MSNGESIMVETALERKRREAREAAELQALKVKEFEKSSIPSNKDEIRLAPSPVASMPAFDDERKIDVKNSQKIDRFRLSYIEDYEEEEARRLIEESLGFEPIRAILWQVAIKVYTRPEDIKEITTDDGRKISIYLPDEVRASDKHVNCVGLVINMGPGACKGKYFEEPIYMQVLRFFFGKWMSPSKYPVPYKIGDWVVFDRNSGPQINYRGVPITLTEDKFIRAVVSDPTYVTRY